MCCIPIVGVAFLHKKVLHSYECNTFFGGNTTIKIVVQTGNWRYINILIRLLA